LTRGTGCGERHRTSADPSDRDGGSGQWGECEADSKRSRREVVRAPPERAR
jgi:hypothetical protein